MKLEERLRLLPLLSAFTH